jgi:hypothetical protein
MRLAQAKVFESTLIPIGENPPKDELPSSSDTHGAPNGAAVTDRPASHDAPAAPASDDPVALDPLLVPELPLPLAAPLLPEPASLPWSTLAAIVPHPTTAAATPTATASAVKIVRDVIFGEPQRVGHRVPGRTFRSR